MDNTVSAGSEALTPPALLGVEVCAAAEAVDFLPQDIGLTGAKTLQNGFNGCDVLCGAHCPLLACATCHPYTI